MSSMEQESSLQTSYEYHYMRGMNLYASEQYKESMCAYRKALALNSGDADIYRAMGAAQREQGNLEAALEFYKKAIEVDNSDIESYQSMGVIYYNMDRLQEAEVTCLDTLKLDPESVQAHQGLCAVYSDHGKYEDAIREINLAISIEPDDSTSYNWLGAVLYHTGKYDEAVETLQRSIDLYFIQSYPYNALGKICRIRQDYESAINFHSLALTYDENDSRGHIGLAGCYKNLGRTDDYEREIELARKTIDKDKAFVRICFDAASGNTEAALKSLGPFLESHPGFLLSTRVDPDFQLLRDNPHFMALVGLQDG